MPVATSVRIKAALLTLGSVFYSGCKAQTLTPEAILAVRSGNRPFTDSIIAVPTDGSASRVIFSSSHRRSYSGVAARSLAGLLVVRVRDLEGVTVKESLVDLDSINGKPTPSCRQSGRQGGMGVLSPDGKTYAFPNAPSSQGVITFVECGDAGRADTWDFTDSDTQRWKKWYVSLSWSPSGTMLIAVKAWKQPDRGLQTELQLIDVRKKTAETILSREDIPIAAVIISDEQCIAFTRNGLELLTFRTGLRNTVFAESNLNGRSYSGGGMAWLNHSRSVAVSLRRADLDIGELWLINLSDGSSKLLHQENGFRFSG